MLVHNFLTYSSLQTTSVSKEDVNDFLMNATAFLDLIDHNKIPPVNELSYLIDLAGISSGTLQIKDQNELKSLRVAKLDKIASRTNASPDLLIFYNVYFPVKFDISGCFKRKKADDPPIFYKELISSKKPQLPFYDYQLCEEFEYKNRSFNGFHIQNTFYNINFTEFEEKMPSLVKESYYMDFKSHLLNFTKLDSVEKTRIKFQILNGVRRTKRVF